MSSKHIYIVCLFQLMASLTKAAAESNNTQNPNQGGVDFSKAAGVFGGILGGSFVLNTVGLVWGHWLQNRKKPNDSDNNNPPQAQPGVSIEIEREDIYVLSYNSNHTASDLIAAIRLHPNANNTNELFYGNGECKQPVEQTTKLDVMKNHLFQVTSNDGRMVYIEDPS